MKINLEQFANINIDEGSNIIEPQLRVYITRNDIKKYNIVDDEIIDDKKTLLRVFYNKDTQKITETKLVLSYSIGGTSDIDYELTKYQKNKIKRLINSEYGADALKYYDPYCPLQVIVG